MKTTELLSNRCNECAECGKELTALRLMVTNLCVTCDELLKALAREDEKRQVQALLGKPWWWFHNPLNAKAFRDAQKGVRS